MQIYTDHVDVTLPDLVVARHIIRNRNVIRIKLIKYCFYLSSKWLFYLLFFQPIFYFIEFDVMWVLYSTAQCAISVKVIWWVAGAPTIWDYIEFYQWDLNYRTTRLMSFHCFDIKQSSDVLWNGHLCLPAFFIWRFIRGGYQ